MDIIGYLKNHALEDNISFHTPGHKGMKIFEDYGFKDMMLRLPDMDITEIQGADNLFQPRGILRELERGYSNLYDSKRTHILINGSSAGILASILGTVKKDDKILMSRNCHSSVYNAVMLAGATPVYVMPNIEDNFGIIGDIGAEEIKKALIKDEDIKVVVLPSPSYYGICSDIEKIAKVVHRFNKILIIDQAHGAHLKLFDKFLGKDNILPKSAEVLGADIVINSTHKTLATFTQSAIINIMSDRVNEKVIMDKLRLVQSTSPSYILMLSLALNLKIIEENGEMLISKWKENLQYFYKNATNIEGLEVLNSPNLDISKLNLRMSGAGIDGGNLEKRLMEDKIYMELVTGDIVMGMSGIGNEKRDFEKLLYSLEKISKNNTLNIEKEPIKNAFLSLDDTEFVGIFNDEETISLKDAKNRVSAENICPYPPGIPILCKGERITEKAIDIIMSLMREDKLIYGISDRETIRVYKN